MKENIPDDFIDLTVTSPPYDNLRKYNGFIFDYKSMANELYRVTKNGGAVVWIVGDSTVDGSETLTSFEQALYFKSIGFRCHTMIYEKQNGIMAGSLKMYKQAFEYMFVFSKGKMKTTNLIKDKPNKRAGEKKKKLYKRKVDGHIDVQEKNYIIPDYTVRNNIWGYLGGLNLCTKDKIAFKHPAVFPEQLAEDHIKSWSNEGDIVFDPMCGSGTTCKMAWINKRNFIGVDMSAEYINDICVPRLQQYGWNTDMGIKIS